MTTVTDDWVQRLVTLALDCRPTGAPRWDGAGIAAAIRKVQHLALADVAHAVIRAAEDRNLRTPAPIGVTTSPCWRERDDTRPRATSTPPRRTESCTVCGRHVDACLCDDGPTRRPPVPAPNTRDHIAAVRAAIGKEKR